MSIAGYVGVVRLDSDCEMTSVCYEQELVDCRWVSAFGHTEAGCKTAKLFFLNTLSKNSVRLFSDDVIVGTAWPFVLTECKHNETIGVIYRRPSQPKYFVRR